MKLKYITRDNEITTDFIGRCIQDFQTRYLPNLNMLWNYYTGKQKITKKKPSDIGKPNNIAMVNYCNSIVGTYSGYITGIPVTYSNDDFQDVIDIINYNDPTQEDAEYLRNALIYGRAFECNYIDEEGKQRFRLFNTKECLPIYSNSLESQLLYVVRFYKEEPIQDGFNRYDDTKYLVEVYGPGRIQKYRSNVGFSSFELLEDYPHFFNQCPVTVFSLNEDEESIFSQVITLQDCYNTLLSSGVDDFEAWADAYLVLKGVVADNDDLNAMKATRTMMIDNDASAEYLTKNTSSTQLEFLLKTLNDQIHTIANSPDFNDEKFLAQSGEALKYKLIGLENRATTIENNMRKALQRRIELICSILSLTDTEDTWRDVAIRFTRNMPNSLSPITVSELMQYKGLVSDETLLELVPFIQDPADEMKKMDAQTQKELDLEYGHEEATPTDR